MKTRTNELHGLSKTPTYRSWASMLTRCTSKKFKKNYPNYTKATVCKRWRSFTNFLSDMGPRPGLAYTLDRIDNDNPRYGPGLCRWTIRKIQQRNRSDFNKWIEYCGPLNNYQNSTYEICQLAELAGIEQRLLRTRIIQGMNLEKALQPINFHTGKPLKKYAA